MEAVFMFFPACSTYWKWFSVVSFYTEAHCYGKRTSRSPATWYILVHDSRVKSYFFRCWHKIIQPLPPSWWINQFLAPFRQQTNFVILIWPVNGKNKPINLRENGNVFYPNGTYILRKLSPQSEVGDDGEYSYNDVSVWRCFCARMTICFALFSKESSEQFLSIIFLTGICSRCCDDILPAIFISNIMCLHNL